ncbi:hypothetical protein AB0K48_45725 [Nonomuraea sp. NPDC055795]
MTANRSTADRLNGAAWRTLRVWLWVPKIRPPTLTWERSSDGHSRLSFYQRAVALLQLMRRRCLLTRYRLDATKPAGDPTHQVVEADHPAGRVYSVGHGHYVIFGCLHKLRMILQWSLFCNLNLEDREVSPEY